MNRRDRSNRVVVVGAGVMGAWTALELARRGHAVTLIDAYGVASSLASSGGETRLTRSAHARDTHYPRWQRRSLVAWKALEQAAGRRLFLDAGVLWFAHRDDGFEADALRTLPALDIPVERLAPDEVGRRFPGIAVDGLAWALFEPEAGVLLARRGVRAVVDAAEERGVEMRIGRVEAPAGDGDRLGPVRLASGEVVEADAFVFACGPWLPKLVADAPITPTRQEVVFIAPPPGDDRFHIGPMPGWVDYDAAFYGLGSVERRGFKIAPDSPGEIVDPDSQSRVLTEPWIDAARGFVRERFPSLAAQPVSEGRVCQYEATPDSHFLIDRHPAWSNAWVVGGGSGHGFKHGPVIGEFVAAQVVGDTETVAALAPPDNRFAFGPRQPSTDSGLRTSGSPAHRHR
jgi:glycine/D-amino acid oxidase-like deaminating enzyme